MSQMPMAQPETPVDQYQETAMNIMANIATIICMPILMVVRPQFGSEYFSPALALFTTVLMAVLAAFAQVGTGIARMFPSMAFHGPEGLYGIATLAKLYFVLGFIHSARTWRLMTKPHLEENSFFIGPPLFIFRPFPLPWWIVRIVVEPVFVFLLALTLRNLFILQDSAADYLMIAAVAIAVKAYFEWFMEWRYIRHALNAQNLAQTLARILSNTATNEDVAKANMAALPKDMREEMINHFRAASNPNPTS